jgi:hypothetical protein
MDWYTTNDGTYQFNPDLNKDNQAEILKKGQTYIGATHKDGTGNYRKDGSIMFSNETDAYNRMWSQANEKGVEQSGYALKDGKILVMPDYANEAREVDISKYDYSINNDMTLSHKDGDSFSITGNIHTHQDPTGNATPSYWTGDGWGDVGHSKGMGGLPVIVMGHDGKVHGVFYSTERKGYQSIPGFGSRDNLLSGKTKLVPWLRTYPTKGQ